MIRVKAGMPLRSLFFMLFKAFLTLKIYRYNLFLTQLKTTTNPKAKQSTLNNEKRMHQQCFPVSKALEF